MVAFLSFLGFLIALYIAVKNVKLKGRGITRIGPRGSYYRPKRPKRNSEDGEEPED